MTARAADGGAAPRCRITAIELFERDVRLRMPFRFGVLTLTEAPQAFVRARIRLDDGREAEGGAAELLAPKWFDKSPALTNEDNFDQLRDSLCAAREEYLAHDADTAWGHAGAEDRRGLVASYGPALIDRAVLDALCRALGISFYRAVQANRIGAEPFEGIDLAAFFATLNPATRIAARHTVGLADLITAADPRERVNDGLPETLDEVLARYRPRYFKLKLGGEARADLERLARTASVLDRIEAPYHVSLDGNEQYDDMEGVLDLWRRLKADRRLERLARSILYLEQPLARHKALACNVSGIEIPVIVDESDDALDAFPRARALGYSGVSSKTCKGIYRSLVNAARCAAWNREEKRFFMTGEDLTAQAGLALQQDLALASLLGLAHVERNGHHYVNGMMGLPEREQGVFLAAHPDLYEHSHGAVRLRIAEGELAIGSLDCTGYASRALPHWETMRPMQLRKETA